MDQATDLGDLFPDGRIRMSFVPARGLPYFVLQPVAGFGTGQEQHAEKEIGRPAVVVKPPDCLGQVGESPSSPHVIAGSIVTDGHRGPPPQVVVGRIKSPQPNLIELVLECRRCHFRHGGQGSLGADPGLRLLSGQGMSQRLDMRHQGGGIPLGKSRQAVGGPAAHPGIGVFEQTSQPFDGDGITGHDGGYFGGRGAGALNAPLENGNERIFHQGI